MKKIVIIVILLIIVLIGYFQMNDYKFIKLVKEDIYKIEKRNQGNGYLYTTKDKKFIDTFVSMMDATTYKRRPAFQAYVGISPYELYDVNGKKIGEIIFYRNNKISINGKTYLIQDDISLESFNQEFFLDKNIIDPAKR